MNKLTEKIKQDQESFFDYQADDAWKSFLKEDFPLKEINSKNLILNYLAPGSCENSAFSRCGEDDTYKSYITEQNIQSRIEDFCRRFGFVDTNDLHSRLKNTQCLADIGSGPGIYVQHLARLFPEKPVLSLDSSEMLLAFDRHFGKLPNVVLVLADLNGNLPFRDFLLDFVIMDYVLSHVDDAEKVLAQVADTMKPDGLICLSFSLKQPALRESTDTFLRENYVHDAKSADNLARDMTLLAKELSELDLKVDLASDYPSLGIKAGKYDLQRFIYHYFLKCFWNGDMDYSLKRNRNNFIYPWKLFEPEKALEMVEKNFTVLFKHQDASSLSLTARKKLEKEK